MKGESSSSASQLKIQSSEEWCCAALKISHTGGMGRAEPFETQQGQVQGPALETEEPGAPLQSGANLLECSSAEKSLGVLVARLPISSSLMAKKGRVAWAVLVRSLPVG